MNGTEFLSVFPAHGVREVREVVADIVAEHGLKRGLAAAAAALGVSERWLRALRYGEPARVSAETYLRAMAARRALARERAARLRAELAHLERLAGDHDDHAADLGADLRLGGGPRL